MNKTADKQEPHDFWLSHGDEALSLTISVLFDFFIAFRGSILCFPGI